MLGSSFRSSSHPEGRTPSSSGYLWRTCRPPVSHAPNEYMSPPATVGSPSHMFLNEHTPCTLPYWLILHQSGTSRGLLGGSERPQVSGFPSREASPHGTE